MTRTVKDLAYCAGVIDSDGHIGIHLNWYRVRSMGDAKNPTYQPRISLKQCDSEAIELFRTLFGGYYYLNTKNRQGNARPQHVWQVHSRACREVLESITPFLRIKVKQAKLLLEVCALNAMTRRQVFPIPAIIPGEKMLPLEDAARLAGRSWAVARQCVEHNNIPYELRGEGTLRQTAFVPESFIKMWAERSQAPTRRADITERLQELHQEMRLLNSRHKSRADW